MSTTSRSSGGLLLAAVLAGEHVPPTWAELDLPGGLTVCVATDALRALIPESDTPLRLPASYAETIAICRELGCLPPTAAISDAVWAAAAVRVAPRGLVVTANDAEQMATVEWTLRHNAAIETALRGREVPADNLSNSPTNTDMLSEAPSVKECGIVADVGKDWILDNGLSVRGAVNYGWRASATHLLQPLGHAHNAAHFDYSQVLRLVRREAHLDGETVDLLDVLVGRGLAERWAAPYR